MCRNGVFVPHKHRLVFGKSKRNIGIRENLNNIGSDIFEVQVNNVYENDEEELVTYGIDNLTDEEQKELFKILKRLDDKNEQKQQLRITS